MIKIEITGKNPLEALANMAAIGLLCMENKDVSNAGGTILEAARQELLAPAVEPEKTAVPPTAPPTSPSTAPAALIGQSPAGSAGAASPSLTTPSDTAPAPAPVTGVPVAAAPTYTLEQISRAGAELLGQHPELREALMGLLKDQGVEAVYQLDPAQYGAYATALRGLGAKI